MVRVNDKYFINIIDEKLKDRILSKVKIRKPHECWEWQGAFWSTGYGRAYISGKSVGAHRVVFEIFKGPIPPGFCVLHKCDNPRCCNPAHLFLGTHKDNVKDKVIKGRQAKGEKNSQAKLTEEEVCRIRYLYDNKLANQVQIAEMFGMSQQEISNIVRRRKWAS